MSLTDLVLVAFPTNFFGRPGAIGLGGFRSLSALANTEDIGNDISSTCGASLRLGAQGNLDVRLALRIGVILRVLAQTLRKVMRNCRCWRMNSYLVDDKLIEFDLASTDLLSDGGEILVDVLHDGLRGFTRENLI